MSESRGLLWILLIACAWTELGLSGMRAGVFRADLLMHNFALWTEAARETIIRGEDDG